MWYCIVMRISSLNERVERRKLNPMAMICKQVIETHKGPLQARTCSIVLVSGGGVKVFTAFFTCSLKGGKFMTIQFLIFTCKLKKNVCCARKIEGYLPTTPVPDASCLSCIKKKWKREVQGQIGICQKLEHFTLHCLSTNQLL